MSMAIIGVSAGLALTGAGIGISAAGVGQPGYPNEASSSKQLSDVEASLLPEQRALQAAANEGGSALNYGYTQSDTATQMRDKLNQQIAALQQRMAGAQAGASNGQTAGYAQRQLAGDQTQLASLQAQLNAIPATGNTVYLDSKGNVVPASQAVANFAGYGSADVQGAIASQNAVNQLALAQKFDPQYIAQALSQEAQADPQSVAARAEESNLIQQQINRPLNEPVSDMLNSQLQEQVNAANNNSLTPMDQARLNAAVSSALGDRGPLQAATMPAGTNAFAQPLTTGFAGEQRQTSAAQAATGLLASGSSPEDIQYRREQQNLANLSAEVNGKTPESEFSSLSGAQSGPTPNRTAATPLPTMPDNGMQAQGPAMQNWNTQSGYLASQANPWMTGLSSLINVGGAAANLGWKPLAGGAAGGEG
jgi:hypothetical protein